MDMVELLKTNRAKEAAQVELALLIKGLMGRLSQWRAELVELRKHGFDYEADTLSACIHELAEDLDAAYTVQ